MTKKKMKSYFPKMVLITAELFQQIFILSEKIIVE